MFDGALQRPAARAAADRRPHAVVIGSGFGGLAAAVRLGARGYRVTVLERLDAPGGRAYVFRQDGFTFDAGPTIVTAPFLFEELWSLAGRRFADDVDLVPMDPFYRIRFDDGSTFDTCGDAAAMRSYEDPETGAVMVHDPHHNRLIAIAEVTHRSFVLLDPAEQQRRVTGWSRVLSTACRSSRLARLQVLERTLPDSGTGLARWWAEHGTDDDSWVARTYRELIDRAGPAAERHVTTISIALDMKAAGRAIRSAGGGLRGAAAVLRQEMHTLSTALGSADLKPAEWLTPPQLAIALRSAYDPQVAATLERSTIGADLATAGPVAINETWDRLRSDSAYHAVLWISEWPRSPVYPGFLAPILLSSGIRRAFSVVCDPVRADVAARDIRKKKTEYISDAAQRAKIGQIEDAQQTAEYHDVLQQEADLTAGHGVLRYTGLLAVSAPTLDDLDAAVAEIEQAAIQASCETRRLVGQQAQAFVAAALPLCRGI